jgi:hypothetical protein
LYCIARVSFGLERDLGHPVVADDLGAGCLVRW